MYKKKFASQKEVLDVYVHEDNVKNIQTNFDKR